jgi:DNA primase
MAANEMSFCFCKGELVDCIPGRVQDCNMKQVHTCPLLEEIQQEQQPKKKSKKQEQAFCFIKGELVDCIPGRVQDCNMKQMHTCPLEEEKKAQEQLQEQPKKKQETKKQQAFCFCKGELVDCIPGRVQDCNMKHVSTCPLEEEAKEEQVKTEQQPKEEQPKKTNGFCFFKGELVECSPGRIQDCNVKQLHKCPKE